MGIAFTILRKFSIMNIVESLGRELKFQYAIDE